MLYRNSDCTLKIFFAKSASHHEPSGVNLFIGGESHLSVNGC